MTIASRFDAALKTRSDIQEHLIVLYQLATLVERVTEFGTRGGNSTLAFLHARPRRLVCYDLVRHPRVDELVGLAVSEAIEFEFRQEDLRQLQSLDETDLLFLDSRHTRDQVAHELSLADAVRRYIVLHDTVTFGLVGEDGQVGIWAAVASFLRTRNDWRLAAMFTNNNGLTVLERRPD